MFRKSFYPTQTRQSSESWDGSFDSPLKGRERIVNAAEAAQILDCSRQYINDLIKNGRLHPIKASEKNTLLLKSEVVKISWK